MRKVFIKLDIYPICNEVQKQEFCTKVEICNEVCNEVSSKSHIFCYYLLNDGQQNASESVGFVPHSHFFFEIILEEILEEY